jgi:hypothetical protein
MARPERYRIYDLKQRQLVYTAQPLRTKTIARNVRREVARLVGDPVRFIVVPGPDHKRYTACP